MRSVIVGAGTYGEVYLSYLRAAEIDVVGFLDDDPVKAHARIHGVPVLGTSRSFASLRDRGILGVYCPIGANQTRVRLNEEARAVGLATPNFIHDDVILGSEVPRDAAIYMLPGAIVMPHVTIERDVMISMAVHIAHHSILRQGVFLSTGVAVGASMELGCNAYVGMKATLVTGKCRKVGPDSIVGAGAVVLNDVAPGSTVAGVPARSIR